MIVDGVTGWVVTSDTIDSYQTRLFNLLMTVNSVIEWVMQRESMQRKF